MLSRPGLADESQVVPAETRSCTAKFTVTETLERRHALDFRCSCGCGGDGVAMLIRLLHLQFGDAGPPPEVDRLFVGRLEEQLPEVAESLARAAAGTPAWDAARLERFRLCQCVRARCAERA